MLLLEEHLLAGWRGFNFTKYDNTPTDYDRACDVDDYVGIIKVGDGYGIVLGDEPLLTVWLDSGETKDSLLVRWQFAENETAVIEALANRQEIGWKKTGVKIQFSDDKIILFDSAYDGNQINERLEVMMPKGWYEVETFHWKPSTQTLLIIHRFVPNKVSAL